MSSAGVGGATDLVIADGAHGHTADAPGLSTDWLLTIAEAAHAHAADSLGLSTEWLLNVADSSHAHAADNLGLSTDWLLTIAEAAHAHAADNLTLDTSDSIPLTIAEAAHGHTADGLTLTLDTWLSIADALHLHTTYGVALSAEETLAIAEALHAHAADNLTLGISTFSAEQLAEILAYIQGNLMVPTAEQIAAAVRAELATELTAGIDVWRRHGLDPAAPLTQTSSSISAGAINMAITGDPNTSVTVTRQP